MLMREIAEIIGRLIVVLVLKGILVESDKEYILGHMTEAEWIEEDT